MMLSKLAVKYAVPLPQVEAFTRYLFIGPHPDDIEIGAGATIAKLRAMGKEVCYLICTDGRYGDTNCRGVIPEALAATRKAEAKSAAEAAGVGDIRFLDLCDGGGYTQDALLKGIAEVVGDFRPDIIFAPDPDVRSECHADHLNVGRAAKQLACFAPYPNIMAGYGARPAKVQALALYMTAKPNRYVNTTGHFKKQLSMIFDYHLSQYPAGCTDTKALKTYLKVRAVDNGLHCCSKSGEAFRMLTATRMHCLPEADLL